MTDIIEAGEQHFAAIVALNAAAVQHTSPMDRNALRVLHAMACYHRVALADGQVAAFLLALREGAAYDSDNYRYFCSSYDQFLYVDRIVVAPEFAGRKIGSALYHDLFEFARVNGTQRIACEYNIEPPNPASKAFHSRFGFTEVGTQWVAGGTKRVSLQVANA